MIGMSIRLGLREASLVAQNVEIGKHRGVGRPAIVAKKSAWLDQPNYSSQFTTTTQVTPIVQHETIAVTSKTIASTEAVETASGGYEPVDNELVDNELVDNE